MSGCELKTGFFALRACTGMVVAGCRTCRRAMCAQHAEQDGSLSRCLDCAARERQAARPKQAGGGRGGHHVRHRHDHYDEDWMRARRDSLHRGVLAGTAVSTGAYAAGAFDERDIDAFDHLREERDELEFDAPGFGAS